LIDFNNLFAIVIGDKREKLSVRLYLLIILMVFLYHTREL